MPLSQTTGLRYWMLRVLEECDNVATDFSADPVHDLRVSLRRCRSLADGMMAMDPDRSWKDMKRAGKQLFQRLGALRDVQIMMEWIEKLDIKPVVEIHERVETGAEDAPLGDNAPTDAAMTPSSEPSMPPEDASRALIGILKARETECKREARRALEEFDRKQWRQWSNSLPVRAGRIRPGTAVFKHLALERWTAARELHARAMRNRSQVALHTLRIGIKRFRYIVENFLPVEHKAWSNDLKHMQDLLGEVHDLDVLWANAVSNRVFASPDERNVWHTRVVEERSKRVLEYREKTVGANSLWDVWRAGLPQTNQVEKIATQRMKLWAKVLDPDFAHSERVARLALELYDGLLDSGKVGAWAQSESENGSGGDARSSLYAAALLHDVGKAKGEKGHHKESLELIKKHGTPLGWKSENMNRAALVARFHCGALPRRSHKNLRDLLPDEQRRIIRLAAVLRLANAMDAEHDGRIQSLRIENDANRGRRTNGLLRKPAPMTKNEAVVIAAEGYADGTPTAQAVAAERYLLETVLRRPVFVIGARPSATGNPKR